MDRYKYVKEVIEPLSLKTTHAYEEYIHSKIFLANINKTFNKWDSIYIDAERMVNASFTKWKALEHELKLKLRGI